MEMDGEKSLHYTKWETEFLLQLLLLHLQPIKMGLKQRRDHL